MPALCAAGPLRRLLVRGYGAQPGVAAARRAARPAVSPRILVTGRRGQVGWELVRALAGLGEVIATDRQALDLLSPESIRACLRRERPRVIVNAAAYTAVDQAEQETEQAFATNAVAPGILAEEAGRADILLVHYSTDYVFDGAKAAPYHESDPTAPLNVYGRTKEAGERAIRDAGARHLILRTSWVYGTRGKNFLNTILRLARERETLRIVSDQIGAPTWSRQIAEATAQILSQMFGPRTSSAFAGLSGTFHLAAGGAGSWFEFASAIVALDPRREEHRVRSIEPIPTESYPTPARRPLNSRLDCTAVRETFGIEPVHWKQALALAMESG